MKYTQEQLESMTKRKINEIAFNLKHPNESCRVSQYIFKSTVVCGLGTESCFTFNPCNCWHDCGSLIDELKVGILRNRAFVHLGDERNFATSDKNIKRAVTIAYILGKQEQGQ